MAGTIEFESTALYKTRFFTYEGTVDNNTEVTINVVETKTSHQMYENEPTNTADSVYFRSYEIYIDTKGDTTVGYKGMARITTDSTKTGADGYDIYVSQVPEGKDDGKVLANKDSDDSQLAGGTTKPLTIKNISGENKMYKIVFVAEDTTAA